MKSLDEKNTSEPVQSLKKKTFGNSFEIQIDCQLINVKYKFVLTNLKNVYLATINTVYLYCSCWLCSVSIHKHTLH
jgi:hypothetical protein